MKTKSKSDRGKSKRPQPKQQREKRAAKQSALSETDQQETCEWLDGKLLEDDRRRRLEADARAEENCLRLLRRIAPKHNHAAKIIRQHSTQCFFYPAADLDWFRPLSLFSAKCDLFVLTDWRSSRKAVLANLNRLHTRRESTVQMHTTEVVELCVPKLPYGIIYTAPYMPNEHRPNHRQSFLHKTPFAWLADVEVTVKRRKRSVQLLYMNLEGVGAYWQYFAAQDVAPKYLCWRAASGFALNWTEFHRWDQALGKAVDTDAQKPTYVGSDVKPKNGYDWPWNNPVQQFPQWGVTIYSRKPSKPSNKERL
jgi:hypothetical protein